MSHHKADVIVRVAWRFKAAETDIADQKWLEIIQRFGHSWIAIRLGAGNDVELLSQ